MSFSEKYVKFVYWMWARCYDDFIDPIFKFDRKKVVRELQIHNKDKVLEVGIGTGLNLQYYPKNCEITGVDFSSSMISKAKSKYQNRNLKFVVADARKLPFSNNSFNKALTTYVLRVSPEPKKIMKEVSRVVKKKGLFVIVDQFKGKNKLLLMLVQPFKLLLGWGKEHYLEELLRNTSWKILSNKQCGLMKNTRLIVLRNNK